MISCKVNLVDCVWNVMAHAQEPDFVLLRLKYDGTCAETRFRLTTFEMWWHMRTNQISSYCLWNMMAHAQKPDFVLLRLKYDGTCAETRFRLHCFWNMMAHAQKPNFVLLRLKCNGTCAETRFRLSAKRTSPFQSAGPSVQSTTGSWGMRISGNNAGYTTFRGSVKSTGYTHTHTHHSPVSPSLPLPCVTVCHHVSTGLYHIFPHYLINGTILIYLLTAIGLSPGDNTHLHTNNT
jgi:hypothetical protein